MTIVITFGPIVLFVLARRSMGIPNAAAALVTWGAVFIAAEHGGFATSEALALASVPQASAHMRYHFFMGGVYAVVAAGALIFLAWTHFRRLDPRAWFALLLALLVGGGFELLAGRTILAHGFPPDSIPTGLSIYAYIVAWIAALVMTYRPVFAGGGAP